MKEKIYFIWQITEYNFYRQITILPSMLPESHFDKHAGNKFESVK